MESSRKKIIAGGIVFAGIIGIGAVIYNFVELYMNMPSQSEVMNFTSDTMDSLPDSVNAITGSLVPDTATSATAPGDTVTTLPTDTSAAPVATKEDWLTEGQRRMLATMGIDETALPATLTPELEACFIGKLGVARVEAIKSGETPTVIEGMKAATCL